MTAVAISKPGGPEVLIPEERPVPEIKEGELLIEVAAAGVNRPDCLQRLGKYPPPPGAPDIPGLEIAGKIVAMKGEAGGFAQGDLVTALVPGGGYAQYCAVHHSNALPVPKGLGMTEAAAIPETYFTVWHNVFQRGGLKQGEVILIHGGSSGIGTTAIQLAKAFGAIVIVTAGSAAKCDACKGLGADLAVNYRETDFVEAVRDFTSGRGADLVLDMVGGSYIERNYNAAAEDGRIVQIAFLQGSRQMVDFTRLMVKRLTHTGSTLRPRPISFKAQIARELRDMVWPLIEAGKARPLIDSAFPLAEASRAHQRMEEGSHIGKIVLTVI